jgi:hypothetical protein
VDCTLKLDCGLVSLQAFLEANVASELENRGLRVRTTGFALESDLLASDESSLI